MMEDVWVQRTPSQAKRTGSDDHRGGLRKLRRRPEKLVIVGAGLVGLIEGKHTSRCPRVGDAQVR
jgi:pyruvate/2-oxoglutarate dehydrogenase complex dihydrolipoamide dehydrogenase (E3) component